MNNNYRDISVSICWFVTTTTTKTQGSLISVCGREKLFCVCVLVLCFVSVCGFVCD